MASKAKPSPYDRSNGDSEKRGEALDRAIQYIDRQYGTGTLMRLGDDAVKANVDAISTGSLSLDIALGIGGVPRGRVVEIYGPESSGKTTLTLHIIANAQKAGGIGALIDAEHALDATYARRLGVDIDNLLVNQPDNGEQALEIAEILVRSNAVDVVAIDSVAALVPRAEIEGDMGDSHMGLQARLMSQALRKLTGAISKSKTTVIFINQIREKIGVMFGSPETTPGGRALKFYSSVRINIKRIGTIKSGDEAVGNRTKCEIKKNKVAAPFKKAEFDIMFNQGISAEGDLIDLGVESGIIDKSGTWLSFGETRLGQGRENGKQFLRDNPDIAAAIREQVMAKLAPDLVKPAPAPPSEASAPPEAQTPAES